MKKRATPILFLVFLFCVTSYAQTVNVSTSTELQNAINAASPGQTIVLADGLYVRSGGFYVNAGINGTSQAPIKLVGNSKTILSSANQNTGYGFTLKGNSYWILEGFSIVNSKKGIVTDNSHHNVIKNIKVTKIGDEGIHLRTYSSFNTVEGCYVDSTGLVSNSIAEGIYVGSAQSNWTTYTGGNPDTCNYNIITNNSFGAKVLSENIDIKEGTKKGIISKNSFNGAGLNNLNSADSWLDVKGNSYKIECNTGVNTIKDGFQTHIIVAGEGDYNVFSNNTLDVGTTGYGILITTTSGAGTASNNIVYNNNTINAGAVGLTNITTQNAPVIIVNAGGDQTVCTSSATLAGNTPAAGTGVWTVVSGIATITNPSSPTSTVTGLVPGSVTLKWTVSSGLCASSADEVVITVNTPVSITAQPQATQTCSGSTASFMVAASGTSLTYQWYNPSNSPISNGVRFSGATSANLTISGVSAGDAGAYYVRVSGASPCASVNSIIAVLTIKTTEFPVVALTLDKTNICEGNTIQLTAIGSGTGTNPIYKFYDGGGTLLTGGVQTNVSITQSVYTLTLSNNRSFYVELTSSSSCIDATANNPKRSSMVAVVVDRNPSVANAGTDESICPSVAYLSGNVPTVGIGVWSFVTGPAIPVINTPNSPNSALSGLAAAGDYKFKWTVSNGVCASSSDDVSITVSSIPGEPLNFLTSSSSVTAGSSVSYSVPLVSGATSYTWYYNAAGVSFVNNGSNEVIVDYSTSAVSGSLYVVADNLCGSSAALSMTITVFPVTGILNAMSINELEVIPNPLDYSSIVKFDLSSQGIVSLELFNAQGAKIQTLINEETLASGTYKLPLKDLSSGLYYVRLKIGDKEKTLKVIK